MTPQIATRRAAVRFAVSHNHDINVTPFIDVMLVLLIVFIIAAPLATTAIKLDIAAGDGPAPVSTPAGIVIDDRGALAIRSGAGTAPTNLDRLGRDLTTATGTDASHSFVTIASATHVRYGAFMAVMDRLHADGFTNVTLAARAG